MYQPKSLHEIRVYHSKIIMSTLRQNGPMTKNDLALKTGLSLSSVTNILKILTDRNLVTLGDKIDSFAGRPATYIVPVLDAVYAIGIEVSQYNVRFVLMNLGEPVLARKKHDVVFENTDAYWDRIVEWLEAFITDNNVDRSKLEGVTLATRLTVESVDRIGTIPILLDRSTEIIDTEAISKKFSAYNFDFTLNTKIAGAIYGLWEAKDLPDYVYLSMDSTIGGCVVRNFEPVSITDQSDNFGHMIVHPGGYRCSCGRIGCLETQCTASGLYLRAGYSNLEEFFSDLISGNEQCAARWKEYLDDFCVALNNLYMAYDLDIVIGGSMAQHLEKYRDEIEQRVFRDYNLYAISKKLIICHEGEFAAAVGAAAVITQKFIASKIV